jgi:nicotinate-nucleotide--dimethylbenzimidazole phosphoribosyltransferase
MTRLAELLSAIAPPPPGGVEAAARHLDSLTKPPGSLGRLEEIALRLALLRGGAPEIRHPVIFTFAADHGVVAEGVSAYPQVVTAQMVENFLRGGAAVNVLARQAGARLVVADFGVAAPLERSERLVACPIGPGTANIAAGPAMTREQAIRAIETGAALAQQALDAGADLLATGEMGIGNTTAASAITAAMTGLAPERVTGHGTGIDDATHALKVEIVRRALDRHRPDAADPIGVLAAVGGLEIGALVGVLIGAVAGRTPVVLDGFIAGAAGLLAAALAPGIAPRLIAGHRSVEPGHAIVLERLGLRPVLELDLRLGEGTGAALAITVIDAAIALRDGMATFGSARVSGALEHITPADR